MCSNVKRFLVFLLLFYIFCSCSKMTFTSPDVKGDEMLDYKHDLIVLAKEIAKEGGIDVLNCNYKVLTENDFIIIEFIPYDINQTGGGGRLYFLKDNGHKYIKMELWQ